MTRTAAHYMQTDLWGDIKQPQGWRYQEITVPDDVLPYAGAYVRRVPGLGKLYYLPNVEGVTVGNAAAMTTRLREAAKGGFALKLELYQPYDEELLQKLKSEGWHEAVRHIQYRHTILIDLVQDEQALLMSFKKRCRYEIKKSQEAGVTVEQAEPTDDNLQTMYELMHATSRRNKFYIRDKQFSMRYWKKFREEGQLKLFFAKHEGDTLAGAVVLTNNGTAWYKDGGSVRQKSNLMAPRLLQWEIMRALKGSGTRQYDLGGIPDPAKYQESSMPGIYVFKAGYSREHVMLMPTLELGLKKTYKLWPKAEPQWLRAYNFFARKLWY